MTTIDATGRTARPGLRAQKKESTRIALADAALHLCQERGYSHVTVSDIVEEVGVSRRTFSNYFASKAECLVSITDGQLDDLITQCVPDSNEDTAIIELKRTLAGTPTEFWQKCAALGALIQSEPELQAFSYASDQRSIDYVTRAVAERIGLPSDDLRLRISISALVACVKECVRRWLETAPDSGTGNLLRLIIDHLDIVNIDWINDARRADPTTT